MGLVRHSTDGAAPQRTYRRKYERTRDGLLAQLGDPDPGVRRWAARDLAAHPDTAPILCERLGHEPDPAVREAMLDTLLAVGTDEVVEGLLPYLRSDDAGLRNAVVEVLQALPDQVAPRMERLLRDPDPDVRIFALDILKSLPHPETPRWLRQVLETENHVNVVGTALDRAAEVGGPELVPVIEQVKRRFRDDAFIGFVADAVIQRIGSGGGHGG